MLGCQRGLSVPRVVFENYSLVQRADDAGTNGDLLHLDEGAEPIPVHDSMMRRLVVRVSGTDTEDDLKTTRRGCNASQDQAWNQRGRGPDQTRWPGRIVVNTHS